MYTAICHLQRAGRRTSIATLCRPNFSYQKNIWCEMFPFWTPVSFTKYYSDLMYIYTRFCTDRKIIINYNKAWQSRVFTNVTVMWLLAVCLVTGFVA